MTSRNYDRPRWKRRRAAFLAQNPLCRFCAATSRTTLATVVDHIRSHKGDETLFWDEANNWQGLCKPCHDRAKRELETTGTSAKRTSAGRIFAARIWDFRIFSGRICAVQSSAL